MDRDDATRGQRTAREPGKRREEGLVRKGEMDYNSTLGWLTGFVDMVVDAGVANRLVDSNVVVDSSRLDRLVTGRIVSCRDVQCCW